MSTTEDSHMEGGDFDSELQELLARHNKSWSDLTAEASELDGDSIPADVRKQVVEHIHTVKGVSENTHYRRLRMFSGRVPVPPGELPFEIWHQHADQMVEEAPLSDEEKRSRLAECLMPPALTFFRKAVKELGPKAPAGNLLAQLTHAFGVACEGDDLFTLFRDTYQEHGEKPSAYLTRLEGCLDQAIQFGGIDLEDADRLRLNQFIRGCIFDNGLVGALQLRQRKPDPPGLVTLLQEVRIEEGAEAVRSLRRQQTKSAKKAHCNLAATDNIVGKLEDEVAILKAQLANLHTSPPAKTVSPADTSTATDLDALHAELDALKRELAQLKSCASPQAKFTRPPSRGKYFCFRCGGPGHMVRECRSPPNAELVQRRLLERSQRPAGNDNGRQQRDSNAPRQ